MNNKEAIVFKSKGWQAVNRMGIFTETYHSLILNYRDLMNEIVKIESYEKPILLLFNNPNLNRYIFNFLATTSALIEAYRSAMKFYENTEIYDYYKQEILTKFTNNSEVKFIKDLRNYQSHYKTANTCLSLEGKVSFETYEFLQYSKWTNLSKSFIATQGSFIQIKPLFEKYFKLIESFYMNIYTKLIQYHQDDFKETIQFASQTNMAIPSIYYQFISK